MKLLILVLVAIAAAYLFSEYRKLNKAIALSHTTPDQTGEFWVGDKDNKQLDILLLGDSIAAGTGIEEFEQSLGGRITEALKGKFYVHLVNRAEKGSWVSDLALDKTKGHWDLVIIVVGSNELIHMVPKKQFGRSLHRLLGELKSNSSHIILVGPGNVSSASALPIWLRVRLHKKQYQLAKSMEKIAQAHGAQYANPLEHPNSRSYFSKDGLHPNASGHKIWFEIIWPKIEAHYK